MEACVSPASPSAFHEYSVSLHDRSSNSSPWGCFGSWIILGHCSSRGNLLVPIKWFPSLLKEKFMQNKWWTWSAHPRADGKSVRVLNRHLPCVRVMHVLDVALLQHTWFKWKGRYLNGEPIIWIRCVGAGKRLIRAWHEHQDQGLKNAGLSQWFCFEVAVWKCLFLYSSSCDFLLCCCNHYRCRHLTTNGNTGHNKLLSKSYFWWGRAEKGAQGKWVFIFCNQFLDLRASRDLQQTRDITCVFRGFSFMYHKNSPSTSVV